MQDRFIASMCHHKLCRDAAQGVILAAVQCALCSPSTSLIGCLPSMPFALHAIRLQALQVGML